MGILSLATLLSPISSNEGWTKPTRLNPRLSTQLMKRVSTQNGEDSLRTPMDGGEEEGEGRRKLVVDCTRLAEALLQMEVNSVEDEERLKQVIRQQLEGMQVPTAYSVQASMYEKIMKLGRIYSDVLEEMIGVDEKSQVNCKK